MKKEELAKMLDELLAVMEDYGFDKNKSALRVNIKEDGARSFLAGELVWKEQASNTPVEQQGMKNAEKPNDDKTAIRNMIKDAYPAAAEFLDAIEMCDVRDAPANLPVLFFNGSLMIRGAYSAKEAMPEKTLWGAQFDGETTLEHH